MDKENGKGAEGNSGSSKVSNPPTDPAALLDAASLFGAYWPRGDANSSNAANLFAAAAAAGGGFGLPPHPSMPFSLLPPSSSGRGMSSYPTTSTSAAAAFSNAYTNTLSVAASQAASLGIPAASAAWWSMASHLAAQDYLARLQASGLNFPSLANSADLQYASLGLPPHTTSSHHKSSSKNSKGSSSLNLLSSSSSSKSKDKSSLKDGSRHDLGIKLNSSGSNSLLLNNSGGGGGHDKKTSKQVNDLNYLKQMDKKLTNSASVASSTSSSTSFSTSSSVKATSSNATLSSPTPSIFTSPLSLASTFDKNSGTGVSGSGVVNSSTTLSTTTTTQNASDSIISNSSILSAALEATSDPNSILGGVRLPPDTEIIKYTSSIVGPKIPGTTNRGRKKTISLDPPLVSVHATHSSTGMLIERSSKRPKLSSDQQESPSPPSSDRVEVIKLPATNGSPSGGLNFHNDIGTIGGSSSHTDTPLNLSLKPSTSTSTSSGISNSSSSLNSLCNMSASLGADRISRRKPGPKPRRVLPSAAPSSIPGTPLSASLSQLFATADSPRPPSRNNECGGVSDGGSSTSSLSTCAISTLTTTNYTTTSAPSISSSGSNHHHHNQHHHHHKEGRPRNLGRGVSKPKKNTVASLLAQSRALGIKPMPILDPNATMNQQQMNLLKSNILAAQQYISEAGGDEKALNKFLQEKIRGTLSDSSTVDASTDSDNNLTDSNHTDSEMEVEIASKKQKQYDERALRVPLEKGWKRETIIRGLTKSGGIKGDVTYNAPDSANKFKQMSDITQYLEYQKSTDLSRENFTFSCRVILGDYLQPVPPDMPPEAGEFVYLSENEVNRRLEELKSAMRTSLPVEQRIEMARKQQAARAAARMDREQARLAKEIERNERQEAARRDREARSQQLLEGRKRLAFTLEQKIQIITEIEGGKTKSDVSRELGLASSTVATIWKNRDNILNAYTTTSTSEQHLVGRCHTPPNNNDLFIPNTITMMAKRKRQEEIEKQKHEEQQRKQQEREFKRQQAAMLKEQMYIQEINKQREMLYTVELERERRRQHMALVKALENRRKLEERERKKQQLLAEKQANKEKKMEQRKMEMEILSELRKPCEDLELDQKPLPDFERIAGLKLSGKAFANILMVFEFLHNFGETLGFDMESLPTLDSLQQALLATNDQASNDAEEELFSVMTHLLVCAIEDPGIPNPARHTTILGQSLRQADITHANLSEILRIYLYANATGEVKALTGVHFERDREKRVADHHQNDNEMQQTCVGKNSQYYELLHENDTWKMSDMLKDKPFMALSPTDKAEILAFICNELLQNKAVIRQIESTLECVGQLRKEKWLLDTKIRKIRMMHSRKMRSEAVEKAHNKTDGEESVADSPSLHKDDLLDEEENEISENESVGTQPEEEEDNKLSGEELGKKLEKLVKSSEMQLQSLNTSTHQLRATCFGQDRYWRRYWSLSKAGGVFVEAMESAEPDVLNEQNDNDDQQQSNNAIKSINDINNLISTVQNDSINNDSNVDKEVSSINENKKDISIDNNDENNEKNSIKLTDDNDNEHRKTPNRLEEMKTVQQTTNLLPKENGEIDTNLDQLRKSVDDIVQNLEPSNNEIEKENNKLQDNKNMNNLNNLHHHQHEVSVKKDEDNMEFEIKTEIINENNLHESIGSKKFNLFEKLGQCMERENKSEEDLKADVKAEVKEELKNEILNELKSEIKSEVKNEDDKQSTLVASTPAAAPTAPIAAPNNESEQKWFTILNKDGVCEGIHLTAGNRWDNGGVGACTRDNLTELKIPVFPPPGSSAGGTNSLSNYHNLCDSPAPLQMTAEESAQLEHIKKHGMPKSCAKKSVPINCRYGWWRICDTDQLKQVLDNLHVRGARERELKRNFVNIMQAMYERQGKLQIEEGQKDLTELPDEGMDGVKFMEGGAPVPDEPGAWSAAIAHRVDMFLLEQVEALEDKVASASMQVKGWKLPNRESCDIEPSEVVSVVRERLASLEINIERRYLKPPLGIKPSCLNISSGGDQNLAAIAQETGQSSGNAGGNGSSGNGGSSSGSAAAASGGNAASTSSNQSIADPNEIPKGLGVWREAVNRAQTSAQLAMCLYSLESSIAWDKSIMKANCQFCHSGDNEDKLLLCDGCDKGYHTYCFKPKMDNIPDGDWYCHECMNKATGERNCIVCGKKSSQTGTRLILCELCPRAYHTDCIHPILHKVPRGKWYCSKCISKKPQKKPVRKNHAKQSSSTNNKDSELSDHPPSSPTPSHCSVTTNEDQPSTTNCNQSDVSSSSLCNVASPSTTPSSTTVASTTQSASTSSTAAAATTPSTKKDRISKKLLKELAPCKAILDDLECHDDAWPFLLPVNTKQFPTYKKIIKNPMDLSTIKKKLQDVTYKSKEEFCMDVRQIFNNCEVFNEDDSPVGKAGHCMRQFFEARWNELTISNS